MNSGWTPETLRSDRKTDVRNHGHVERVYSAVKVSVFDQFQIALLRFFPVVDG